MIQRRQLYSRDDRYYCFAHLWITVIRVRCKGLHGLDAQLTLRLGKTFEYHAIEATATAESDQVESFSVLYSYVYHIYNFVLCTALSFWNHISHYSIETASKILLLVHNTWDLICQALNNLLLCIACQPDGDSFGGPGSNLLQGNFMIYNRYIFVRGNRSLVCLQYRWRN